MRLSGCKEEWRMFLTEIIQQDPEAQLFCLTDSQVKLLSENWDEIICQIWPESRERLVHAILELCDIGDTDKKAAICFGVCRRDFNAGKLDQDIIRRKLYPILNRIRNTKGTDLPNYWQDSHHRNVEDTFSANIENCKPCSPDLPPKPSITFAAVRSQVSANHPELLTNQSHDMCDERSSNTSKGLALHRIFNKGRIRKKALTIDVTKKRINKNKKCFQNIRLLHASRDSGYESDTYIYTNHPKIHNDDFLRKYKPIVSDGQKNKYKAKYKKHHTRYLKLRRIFEQTSQELKVVETGSREWHRIVGEYNKAKEYNKSKSETSEFSIHDQLQYLSTKLKHIRNIIDTYDFKKLINTLELKCIGPVGTKGYNTDGQDILAEKGSSKISNLYEKFQHVLTKHYSWILETLLPSHALPLLEALQILYLEDNEKKAFEALLLLKRYSRMYYTNMESVQCILKTLSENQQFDAKQIKNGIPSEFLNGTCFLYDVVLSQQLPANDEEKETLKEGILRALRQIGTDNRLRQWLYQLHEYKAASYGWDSLSDSLTEQDFSGISIHIPDIFYGGVTHIPVLVKFSYPSDTSNDENLHDRIDKLNQLYRIALENLDSILPKDKKIQIENGVLYLQPKNTEEKEDTVIIKQIREIWGRATHDPTYRNMLVEKLQENNIPFYATEDIMGILSSNTYDDIDTLEVGVWKIDLKGQKTTLIAGTFIWPKMTRRLSELDNTFLPELHKRFVTAIPSCFNKSIGQSLILNLAIYQDQLLLQEAWNFLENNDGILLNLLVHLRNNNGTLKGLLAGLNECKRKDINLTDTQNEEKKKIVSDLSLDLKVFIDEKHKEWMAKFDQRIPNKITSRRAFLEFLENHELSQFPKMDPEEFQEKLRQEEIMDGDQVWFWRRVLGVNYAHVGIFVNNLNSRLTSLSLASGYIIHVQPRKYRKFQAKIIYEPVEKAVHNGDEIFVVQAQNEGEGLSRNQIRVRALKCCDPKITFNYDSYFGSCETFTSKICGTNNVSELNIQGLNVALEHRNEGRAKKCLAAHLHDIQSSGDLLEKLEKRLVESSVEDAEDSTSLVDNSETNVTISDSGEEMDVDDLRTRPLDMPIFPTLPMRQSEETMQDDPENNDLSSLREFLYRLKLSELEELFINEGITMHMLPNLTDHNLKEDIGVKKFGHRWTILNEFHGNDLSATPSSDLGNSIRSVSDSGCSVRSVDAVNLPSIRNQGNMFVYRPGPSTTPHL